ncbi:MAG TPA: NAD(P)/FAD-dependent oxidoreductase [Symbiobacteriaceae bacterium]|jgi:prolycopene isomerase|nr:NAD(P)/FAD-dependent oxidoreductase [Symbiobacteriaceae bacterium]
MSGAYDVIIIGAGIGGLAAAGLLARRGRRVLVLERHAVVGGYCSSFRRGRFIFDAAVHAVGGCAPGDLIDRWLEEVAGDHDLRFQRLDPFYVVQVDGERVAVPADLDELQALLIQMAPTDANAVRKWTAEIKTMGSTLIEGGASPVQQADLLQRIGRVSWAEFLAGRFTTPKLEAILGALCLYAGLEPERLSAAFMLGVLYSYCRGAYYPAGGSQHLTNVMAGSIRRWGGEVRCRAAVDRILLSDEIVWGVRLASGEEIQAGAVISNADAGRTLMEMVGKESLPLPFQRKLSRLERSVSSVTMYLGVKQGGWNVPSHETFYLPSWRPISTNEFYYRPGSHSAPPVLSVCVPTLSEPDLAPPGHHILCITTCCHAAETEAIRQERGKEFVEADLLQHVEHLIPGVTGQIRYRETATPRTFERYTQNRAGSIYGWAKSTTQSWTSGIGPKTPVQGLYMAGHWTQGVHGVYGAFRSGCATAEAVLELQKEGSLHG